MKRQTFKYPGDAAFQRLLEKYNCPTPFHVVRMRFRSKVLTQIHAIVDARLFSGRPWLPDREACDALRRTFVQLGLDEQVPGDTESWLTTALGREHHFDLIMVFTGLWCEWDMPFILQNYGLINESERDFIWAQLGAGTDPEDVMLPVVRKAYFEYYNPPKYLS